MKIDSDNLPNELTNFLREFKDFFENLKISYWLGGGLLQKIHEADHEAIKESWDGKNRHDIDFYCMQEHKENIEESNFLVKKGYQKISHFYHKTAYQKDGKSFEVVYLYYSECDPNVIYYLSHGKKELWETINQNLSDLRRCRMYHHDFPKEILESEEIEISDLKIPALNKLYIQLSYPKLVKLK